MKTLPGLAVIGLSVCFTFAQGEGLATSRVDRVSMEGDVVLTLDQTVQHALKGNPLLKAATLEDEIADWAVMGEAMYWEPALSFSADRNENKRQNTVEQELSQFTSFFAEENMSYATALEGRLLSGAQYRLGYTLEDLANNLTNLNFRERQAFESQFVSFAGISVTQPLLKNAGRKVTEGRLANAEIEREVAHQELRRQTMMTIAQAEAAFWNVWQAERIVKQRAQSMDIATVLVEDNEERMKQGKMAEIEVAQARAGRALRERRWLESQARRNQALQAMMNVLNWTLGDRTVSVDEAAGGELPDSDLAMAPRVKTALAHHPDLQIAGKRVESEQQQLEVLLQQRLPQLDLTGSYGFNGLGLSASDSLEDVTDMEFDSWSLGLVMRVPLGGDAPAKAGLQQSRLRREQALEHYRATETEVANSIQTILRNVQLLRKTLAVLEQEVEINRMAMESERMLLDNGKSTSRRVLEMEEDLADAHVDYVAAKSAYLKALIELELSDGGMLLRRGLETESSS